LLQTRVFGIYALVSWKTKHIYYRAWQRLNFDPRRLLSQPAESRGSSTDWHKSWSLTVFYRDGYTTTLNLEALAGTFETLWKGELFQPFMFYYKQQWIQLFKYTLNSGYFIVSVILFCLDFYLRLKVS